MKRDKVFEVLKSYGYKYQLIDVNIEHENYHYWDYLILDEYLSPTALEDLIKCEDFTGIAYHHEGLTVETKRPIN